MQGTLAEAVINFTPFRWLPGRLQAFLFAAASLFAMPSITDEKDAIKTFSSEAMHFRRGIRESCQLSRVRVRLMVPSSV